MAELTFFDVVIDWCILDAIDDLANPPSSITSVMSNRWLGNDFKRTGMSSAVWSYIKKKKSQLARFAFCKNYCSPTRKVLLTNFRVDFNIKKN